MRLVIAALAVVAGAGFAGLLPAIEFLLPPRLDRGDRFLLLIVGGIAGFAGGLLGAVAAAAWIRSGLSRLRGERRPLGWLNVLASILGAGSLALWAAAAFLYFAARPPFPTRADAGTRDAWARRHMGAMYGRLAKFVLSSPAVAADAGPGVTVAPSAEHRHAYVSDSSHDSMDQAWVVFEVAGPRGRGHYFPCVFEPLPLAMPATAAADIHWIVYHDGKVTLRDSADRPMTASTPEEERAVAACVRSALANLRSREFSAPCDLRARPYDPDALTFTKVRGIWAHGDTAVWIDELGDARSPKGPDERRALENCLSDLESRRLKSWSRYFW